MGPTQSFYSCMDLMIYDTGFRRLTVVNGPLGVGAS